MIKTFIYNRRTIFAWNILTKIKYYWEILPVIKSHLLHSFCDCIYITAKKSMAFISCSSCYILTSWFLSLGIYGRPRSAFASKSAISLIKSEAIYIKLIFFLNSYYKALGKSAHSRSVLPPCSLKPCRLAPGLLFHPTGLVLLSPASENYTRRADKDSRRGTYQIC